MDQNHSRPWYVSRVGLSLLKQREIHFHQKYREQIHKEADDEGMFVSGEAAVRTDRPEIRAIIREWDDGNWVAGIV